MFSRIVEIFSLIRGCRHNWPNHVKTSHAFYDDFFIFVFLNLYYRTPKLPRFITNVMINDTIKKYENKERHQIYVEALAGKNHGQRIKFHYEYEMNYKMRGNKP